MHMTPMTNSRANSGDRVIAEDRDKSRTKQKINFSSVRVSSSSNRRTDLDKQQKKPYEMP
jgi:hypothetical protein